ncbi:MAG: response regulator transcription factor [Actinomycetes bacterium]
MTTTGTTTDPTETSGLVIVDDHELLAQSLALSFSRDGIEATVLRPTTDAEILDAIAAARPALVLLDLMLGDIGASLPLIEPIRALGADVVIMTGEENPIAWAECFEAGAGDVVSKAEAFTTLVDRISAIAVGRSAHTEARRADYLALLREHRETETIRLEPFERLTAREREVLAYLMEGVAAEEIADRTFVALATVRSHIRAILTKLGVNSQLAAVAAARRANWTPPPVDGPPSR